MNEDSLTPQILSLLSFTKTHQRHADELARATGECFNIFNILGVGHLEVKTHSPILAELLNPQGSHGQGAVFLKHFLTQFKIDGIDADHARVETEYYIGEVTEESGGRLDIVINEGHGGTIFIENKIYAGDQENQIERYRAAHHNAHLFYLTLNGSFPNGHDDDSLKKLRCECISYSYGIRSWLKACRKEAACLPHVREVISQYINLVEDLTQQNPSQLMNTELLDKIVESPESLRAFYTLRNANSDVEDMLIDRLRTQLTEIANKTGLTLDASPDPNLRQKYSNFSSFRTPGLSELNLGICFSFERTDLRDLVFGFCKLNNEQPCPVEKEILAEFKQKFQNANSTPWWPAWSYFEAPYCNWTSGAFEAICSGTLAKNMSDKLQKLAEIAHRVCAAKSASV